MSDRDKTRKLRGKSASDLELGATTPLPPGRGERGGADTVPAASRPAAFAVDEVLGERYKVVRFIAHGGMGEVYEVEDLELHERVALKTIRPQVAEAEVNIERFKREIHLARKVTHPNVCRLFEFGHHRRPAAEGAGEDVLFLTMELLEGENLAQRLRWTGRTTTAEALPLVRQMVAGLAAIHQQGIVDRDFKSANVMLVASEQGERAVITDFGLARRYEGSETMAVPVSVTGLVVGTPHYMAPEQVVGEEIGPETDIYALGVVMYEMMTGRLPFRADTPLAVALRRLQEKPSTPRTLVPDLEGVWETVILRCLERAPKDRFGDVNDVAEALSGEGVPEVRGRSRGPAVVASAAVLLVLVAAVAFLSRTREGAAPEVQESALAGTPPTEMRTSLAVLGFKNLGRDDADWISTALTEMIRTELAAGGEIRTISGEDVDRMRMELSLATADSLARDTLRQIRSILGTDLVVLGSYLGLGAEAGGQLRLDSRVQETEEGDVLVAVPETGTEAELFDLVARAGARLRQELGIGALSPEEESSVRAALPAKAQAARLYAQGLAKLRVYDALAARDLLQEAVAVEPEHPLIHAALASAWWALGYDESARQEARRAYESSGELPRSERLLIEGRYRELHAEWAEAVKIYDGLFVVYPDHFDYGLRLAEAKIQAGRADDALAVVATLRRFPPPASDDARLDLTAASAAKALTNFSAQLEAATAAGRRAESQGAKLLYAQARLAECDARLQLGEMVQAREACWEAKGIFSATGDGARAARAENILAVSHAIEGKMEAALEGFERSLQQFRQVGDRRGIAKQLNNVANVLVAQGDLAGAEAKFSEALAISREVADRSGIARALNNIATVLWEGGEKLAEAEATYRESLAIFRDVGATQWVAWTLDNLGEVLYAQRKLDLARQCYEEALVLFRDLEETSDVAVTLVRLAGVVTDQDHPDEAREMLEEARRLYAEEQDPEGEIMALKRWGELLASQGDEQGAAALLAEASRLEKEIEADKE